MSSDKECKNTPYLWPSFPSTFYSIKWFEEKHKTGQLVSCTLLEKTHTSVKVKVSPWHVSAGTDGRQRHSSNHLQPRHCRSVVSN